MNLKTLGKSTSIFHYFTFSACFLWGKLFSNSQVEFSCDIIGTPHPDITWFKDGFEVYDTRRFGFLVEGDRYTLVLKEARLTDEGDIRVRATNRVGAASSQATFIVQGNSTHILP